MTDLSVSGLATVSGELHVQGDGLIEGILNVVDTITTNNFIVNSLADFFGDVTFHSGVTFEQSPTFTSDTGGFAVIQKGSNQVTINFKNAYNQIPVISASIVENPLTPTPSSSGQTQAETSSEKQSLSNNLHYLITGESSKGFTILLNKNASADITFSWLALAVDSPVIFKSNGSNQQENAVIPSEIPNPIGSNDSSNDITSSIISPTQIPLSPSSSNGPE